MSDSDDSDAWEEVVEDEVGEVVEEEEGEGDDNDNEEDDGDDKEVEDEGKIYQYSLEAFQKYLGTANTSLRDADVRNVIHDMIKCRGYTLSRDLDIWQNPVTEELLCYLSKCERRDSIGGDIETLIYRPESRINIQLARELKTFCQQWHIRKLLIISETNLTSSARSMISQVFPHFHHLRPRQLQRCYIHHHLVPEQVRIEAAQLPYRYVSLKQLPRMRHDDVICKFFGWVQGDIIQSKRVFGNGLEAQYYYRYVTND